MASIHDSLRVKFESTPGCDDAFIERCAEICKTYNISPEDLYFKWEVLVLNRGNAIGGRIIDANTAGAIQQSIQSEVARVALNQMKFKTEPGSARKARGGPSASMLGLGSRITSGAGARVGLIQPKTEEAATPMRAAGVGSSLFTGAGPSRVQFRTLDSGKRSYKYMYEKISERSEALDDRIDEFADLVRKHYGIPDLGDPAASTDDEVTVVGRITLDAEATSSANVKLNESSIFLESSRSMGSGVRVPIRFNPEVKTRGGPKGQAGVGLFPGAIVALQGRNGGGGWFSVNTVLALPPLQSSLVSSPDHGGAFSMMIASGPYTPDAELSYTALQPLLRSLTTQKPAVVLLLGPFIDTSHPRIKSGDVDALPEDIFRERFIEPLQDFLMASPDSLVLLVPSVRDMLTSHAVFPQGPLDPSCHGGDSRIKLLPNPTRFTLNGVSFAASSVDTLFHLRKEELVRRAQEVDSYAIGLSVPAIDTMANLCRHLLQQRSFYPVFPTPLELSHEINLDVSHLDELRLVPESDETAPDVLIVTSRLKHFSKVVDHTVAVNPSFMTKGTCAKLEFAGSGDSSISERIKVEVGKIGELGL
ncbi:DNA polymerase alpha, subunit B [Auriscalpium vulgare]|uniref:DNA polymerase alpha, subunit B n=1 Tax=Auriscalpium vulgare TaxID=40419 RepID=A0ACB8S3K3_9AGAM|nr:DNA polymerase alpha, subunit B [Auriscalpium vulgare]